MSETGAVEPRPPRHWSMGDGLALSVDNAMYGATALGYLFALLSPNTFRWPGFLLLTVACGAWIAIYGWFNIWASGRTQNIAIAGLIIAALLAQVAAFWGVQLDWLAPVLTVGVIAAAYPLARSLLLSVGMVIATLAIIILLDAPTAGGLMIPLSHSVTIVPAFAFAFVFSLAMSVQDRQRAVAEELLARLEEAHEQLRSRAKEAEALAVAEERNRMAREIHDTLGHYLTILAVELETALKLEERGDTRLRGQLTDARRVAADCLAEVRHSVAALRPTDPSTLGLDAALARLRAEFVAAQPDIEITLDVEGVVQTLAPELRVALYRCAQESLTNIRKHAQATKALMRVRVDEREVEMTILDNGVGDGAAGDGHEPGFGLLGMRERIALLGGVATGQPEPERGWRVEARVPLTNPPSSRLPRDYADRELAPASLGGVN